MLQVLTDDEVNIGSGVRQQAIIWDNIDPDLWRHMATPEKSQEILPVLVDHFQWRHAMPVTSQWGQWPLKSPASRLFAQPFVQAQIKENIKAPRHGPL